MASILAGYDTVAHVDEAVSYETATEEEKDYASVLANAPAHAWRGQCTYCGHCAPCPAGIDIAMVNKLYDLGHHAGGSAGDAARALPAAFRQRGRLRGLQACEARCPFGVPVASRMEKAAKLLGRKSRPARAALTYSIAPCYNKRQEGMTPLCRLLPSY